MRVNRLSRRLRTMSAQNVCAANILVKSMMLVVLDAPFRSMDTQRTQSEAKPRPTARNRSPDVRSDSRFTVDEVAVALGISRSSAYECAKRGEIPTVRFGRRIVVPRRCRPRPARRDRHGAPDGVSQASPFSASPSPAASASSAAWTTCAYDPQRHRRVGVTETAGDGANVVSARDRRRRGPVPKIVQPPRRVDAGQLLAPAATTSRCDPGSADLRRSRTCTD